MNEKNLISKSKDGRDYSKISNFVLKQMEVERHYVIIKAHEVWKIDRYGIAFCGQNVVFKKA